MSRANKGGAARGRFWDRERRAFVKGWVEWGEEGLVRRSGRGSPPEDLGISYRGVILPLLVNWHTHVGDGLFRRRLARIDRRPGLAELVGPGGLKEKWLAEAPEEELLRAVGLTLEEMTGAGCGSFCDFREGGLAGLELLDWALDRAQTRGLRGVVFGRPAAREAQSAEIAELLGRCRGLGLSALSDYGEGLALEWSQEAHRRGKLVAMHAMEARREPIDEILACKPHLLVHLGAATEGDLTQVAASGAAVAICPSSSRFFGLEMANVPRILELGIEVGLGTDNAMLGKPDLLGQLREAAQVWPGLGERRLTELLLAVPKWLNIDPGYPPTEGQPARLTVWKGTGSTPLARLLAPDCRCVCRVSPN